MSVSRALTLFRGFHRRAPLEGELVSIGMEAPRTALAVGELVGISYRLKGKKRAFWHRFTHRPKLLVSDDGRQIFIVGNARFTSRGFLA